MEPGALIILAFLVGIVLGTVMAVVVRRRTAALFATNPLFAIGKLKDVRACVLAHGDWRDGSPSDDAIYHLGRVEAHLRSLPGGRLPGATPHKEA